MASPGLGHLPVCLVPAAWWNQRVTSPLPAGALGRNRLAARLGAELAQAPGRFQPVCISPFSNFTFTGAIERPACRHEGISVERPESWLAPMCVRIPGHLSVRGHTVVMPQ